MNRIALIGYYGFNNTGDEAILFSILQGIDRFPGHCEVTVLSANPAKTEKRYSVKARNRWKMSDVIKTVRESDILVFGGGSLLQDSTSKRSLTYYLSVARLARFFRKPVYFMAQGVGPVYRPESKSALAKVLNRVSYITVRDRDSKQQLLDMGVTVPPVEVTADVVLGLYGKDIDTDPGKKVLDRNHVGKDDSANLAGFSVRYWRDLSGYRKILARVADSISREGYKVVFVPFHFPDDVRCARDVAKLMEEEAVLIKEETSIIEMFGIVSRMEIMIGMRMHSLIMSGVMGVPAVGVSYDPKIDAIVKLLGFVDGGRVENPDSNYLTHEALQLLANREQESRLVLEKLEPLQKKAARNLEILEELLGERMNEHTV